MEKERKGKERWKKIVRKLTVFWGKRRREKIVIFILFNIPFHCTLHAVQQRRRMPMSGATRWTRDAGGGRGREKKKIGKKGGETFKFFFFFYLRLFGPCQP